MFPPVPPQDTPPEDAPPPAREEPDAGRYRLRRSERLQVLAFAIPRGLLTAVLLGLLVGIVAGWLAPAAPLGDGPHWEPGYRIVVWVILCICAFTPFMILVFTVAMAAQIIARSITRAAQLQARAVRRSSRRDFDSPS